MIWNCEYICRSHGRHNMLAYLILTFQRSFSVHFLFNLFRLFYKLVYKLCICVFFFLNFNSRHYTETVSGSERVFSLILTILIIKWFCYTLFVSISNLHTKKFTFIFSNNLYWVFLKYEDWFDALHAFW